MKRAGGRNGALRTGHNTVCAALQGEGIKGSYRQGATDKEQQTAIQLVQVSLGNNNRGGPGLPSLVFPTTT